MRSATSALLAAEANRPKNVANWMWETTRFGHPPRADKGSRVGLVANDAFRLPREATVTSRDAANFTGLVLGCIEAKICK